MRSQKRGGPPALPPEEAAVTYSRIEDAEEAPAFGADPFEDEDRREPTFTAMRVDPPHDRRREGVRPERPRRGRAARIDVGLDEFDERPLALDPEALGATAGRAPRRRRSPLLRIVLLVGALAVLGGIGVLGATVLKVLYGAPTAVATAPAPQNQTPTPGTDATDIPVATPESVLPDSGSAGPGVLALPSNAGGPIDMTPAAPAAPAPQPQAALTPEPQPQPAPLQPAPQAAPTTRPLTPAQAAASTQAPPLPKPAAAAPMAITPAVNTAATAPDSTTAAVPSTDADINSALSDVDRLLAEKKAQAAAPQTAPQPQTVTPLSDQSAALNLNTLPANQPPPLPAPNTVIDPSIPVPPADIPNPSN